MAPLVVFDKTQEEYAAHENIGIDGLQQYGLL